MYQLVITYGAVLPAALIITNFSTYKYIKLWNMMFLLTTNCDMRYERVLAAGFFYFNSSFSDGKDILIDKFWSCGRLF